MNWYLAKMVFPATPGDNGYETLEFNIQMRLIDSANEQEALMKSLVMGNEEEGIFLSEIGEVIRWAFADVAELTPVPALQDDLQLFTKCMGKENRQSWYSYFFLILQFFL